MISLAAFAVVLTFVVKLLFTTPQRIKDRDGNVLDPVGGTRLKNLVAMGMAMIAKHRESKKSQSESTKEIESFHKPEPHPYFNESYYFNGATETNDRFITRVSRRGEGGKKSYVILLLDIAPYGPLSLEQDDVPVDLTKENPEALGVKYTCLEPLMKWSIKYEGKLRKGCHHPDSKEEAEFFDVKLDLIYERDTPVFWYMRDDNARTLAHNLSQEPWGPTFFKYCLTRSKNHGHYEDYGRCKGSISISGDEPTDFDFGTFRDHSWDIRMWQTMDSLAILLFTLKKPLSLFGVDFHYFDLTLVSMPGNLGGVQRYSTGYVLGRKPGEILTVSAATSINDIAWVTRKDGTREPLGKYVFVMQVAPEPNTNNEEPISLRVTCQGDVRRLQYWPDAGAFEVFEDAMKCTVIDESTDVETTGYGTRQLGFRVGEYDPTKGGCG